MRDYVGHGSFSQESRTILWTERAEQSADNIVPGSGGTNASGHNQSTQTAHTLSRGKALRRRWTGHGGQSACARREWWDRPSGGPAIDSDNDAATVTALANSETGTCGRACHRLKGTLGERRRHSCPTPQNPPSCAAVLRPKHCRPVDAVIRIVADRVALGGRGTGEAVEFVGPRGQRSERPCPSPIGTGDRNRRAGAVASAIVDREGDARLYAGARDRSYPVATPKR